MRITHVQKAGGTVYTTYFYAQCSFVLIQSVVNEMKKMRNDVHKQM